MELALGVSWIMLHSLVALFSTLLVIANLTIIGVLRQARKNMTERNNFHGYFMHQVNTGLTGAAVRVGGHISYALIGIISITVGSDIIRQRLEVEEIWTYILPIMITFVMMITFFGIQTVLGVINAVRMLDLSYASSGLSLVSESSFKVEKS